MSKADGDKHGRPRLANLSIQSKLVLAYGAVLAMFTLTCLLLFVNYQKVNDAGTWVTHTYSVIQRLEGLRAATLQQRVDLVSYTVSHKPQLASDYHGAEQEFDHSYQDLRQLTTDNPSEQRRLQRIADLMQIWRGGTAQAVFEGGSAGAAQAAASEYGQGQLDQISSLVQDAEQEELLLEKQRKDAVDADVGNLRSSVLGMLVLGLLIGAYTIWYTRRQVSEPMVRLTGLMQRIAEGDTDLEVPNIARQDEIGALARGLESFLAVRRAADQENWVRQHLLDINRTLLQAATADAFGEALLSALCHLLHAGYGAFFAWDEAQRQLFLRAGFGYSGDIGVPQRFALGQGLVGQAAQDGKPILLQPVPEKYLRVVSALGEGMAHCLLIRPLQARGVLGVIELALLDPLRPEQEQLLEQLLRSAGLQLDAIVNAERTRALLAQSQAQTEELQASEEELRATNDALQDKNRLLQEQRAQLQESEAALTAQAEELRATNEELEQTSRILNDANVQLEHTRQALEQQTVELSRASQYKSEFLANMSHELRTPLNSVLILAKSLADNDEGNLNADQTESARVIHDSGTQLLRLINDILDLSKVEAGKMTVTAETVTAAEILATSESRFRPVARQKGLALRVECAAGVPTNLRTDSVKVQQILTNLLSNAFKFTDKGRVLLRLSRPAAAPAGAPQLEPERAVLFEVQDSGIGIPADKLEKIFAPFEQVDASTSRKYGGTGLGLAISRRMARLLGGELQVSSAEGQGSLFQLYLPEQYEGGAEAELPPAVVSAAAVPDRAMEPAAPPAAGEPPAILVVEDDETFARVLAAMAQKRGFRALLAHDAATGLALARQMPAAILLDIHLPDQDGWSVLQRLKADAATRHIPVHVVSGVDDSARGFQLGAVGYLVKPVTKEALNQALDLVQKMAARPPRRVLLVGDDEALRQAFAEQLGAAGASIEVLHDGAAALARLAAGSCDCLVLGLSLPDMSAFDLLERAAQGGQLPPVVVHADRELNPDELMRLRAHTDSIVVQGARSQERLLDEVSLFLHSLRTPAGRAAAVQLQSDAADLAGRTVLVVDDDMRNIFALSKVLRARGLNVLMAQDGNKAITHLEQRDGKVDAVLMDVMMPGMDGYETTRLIRARPAWARIPIIAVTAKAMPGDREKCLEAGANDYLSKPIDIDRLLSLLRAWSGKT